MALIALTTSLGVTGTQSTCNATTVNEGDPVNVTCQFDKDIRKLQLDVTVIRSIPGKEPEDLILCAWYGNETEPRIKTLHDATVVGNISNTLTLTIAQAKRETLAGIYKCLVFDSDQNKTTPCTLNISGIPNDSRTSGINETNVAVLSEKEIIGLAIGLPVSVVVLLLICLLVFFFWKRRKHQRNKAQNVCKKAPGQECKCLLNC